LICAELLIYERHAEEVHRALMANHTVQKISFLAKALARIEYYGESKLAILKLRNEDFEEFHLDWDESRDVIDMLMNIESLEAACLFRQDGKDQYKLSLRSKGNIEVLTVAESMGGGGHVFSSGAFLKGPYEALKKKVLNQLLVLIERQAARGSAS
jgi:phosphoesterase RecJ-like protein